MRQDAGTQNIIKAEVANLIDANCIVRLFEVELTIINVAVKLIY